MVTVSEEELARAVRESVNVAEVCRALSLSRDYGGSHAHIRRRIIASGLDTSHFTHRPRIGKGGGAFRAAEDLLVDTHKKRVPRRLLLRAMTEVGFPYRCANGDNEGMWNGARIALEIDHIDGNPLNCLAENLRFLCPNCHSQQESGTSYLAVHPDTLPAMVGRKELGAATSPAFICPDCKGPKGQHAARCMDCRQKYRIALTGWPSVESVVDMLQSESYAKVGKRIGVSATAVRGFLKRNNVDPASIRL